MPQSTKTDPRWLAACTVAVAAAVSPSLSAAEQAPLNVRQATRTLQRDLDARVFRDLQRYCRTSWRNAGICRQEWPDCSQQAVAELIERISADGVPTALRDVQSVERRELNRTVWRIVQRWRRRPRLNGLIEHQATVSSNDDDAWSEVVAAGRQCLTDRQQQILEFVRQGWAVRDIAVELELTAARVSDEKYKAIRKLREFLTV